MSKILEIQEKQEDTQIQTRNMYVLLDKIVSQTTPLFEQLNHKGAIRAVKSMQIKTPEDYDLIYVGKINSVGSIISNDAENLGCVADLIKE